MKRVLQRPASIFLLLIILLVAGIGVATSGKSRSVKTAGDCADDCRERRDKWLERCDQQPSDIQTRCREMAQKQYEKCLERCK
jgi:disulfide bond formation protein DsbB